MNFRGKRRRLCERRFGGDSDQGRHDPIMLRATSEQADIAIGVYVNRRGVPRGKAVCKLTQKAISSEKTPGWGDIEVVTDIAPGIRWISASRHEGFKLDDEANNRLPRVLRKRGGWYEEDVEWTKVVLWYPEAFEKALCFQAIDTFLRYFPDSAAAFADDRGLRIEQGPWGSWTPFSSPQS